MDKKIAVNEMTEEELAQEQARKREKLLNFLNSIRGALITIAFIGGIIGISILYAYLATEVWAR